jgi:osmotically-inducible protein OsmY
VMNDTVLQRNVMNELEWEPSVEVPDIGVEVKDGIVTLNGRVHSFAEKWAAERATSRVAGVKALASEIEVELPNDSRRTDTDIARAVANHLEWNSWVPQNRVKVTVEHGRVNLEGTVDWQFQKNAAEQSVRNLTGVKGISNLIVVAPRPTPPELQGKIEKALERRAELDAKRIRVETTGHKVVLRGTANSWAAREEAVNVAWAAPGVSEVDNEITIGL